MISSSFEYTLFTYHNIVDMNTHEKPIAECNVGAIKCTRTKGAFIVTVPPNMTGKRLQYWLRVNGQKVEKAIKKLYS